MAFNIAGEEKMTQRKGVDEAEMRRPSTQGNSPALKSGQTLKRRLGRSAVMDEETESTTRQMPRQETASRM